MFLCHTVVTWEFLGRHYLIERFFGVLQEIDLKLRNIEEYRSLIDNELLEEIYALAALLQDKRVLYLNSAQNRGGIAEIMVNLVALLVDLDIDAHWQSLRDVPSDFYNVTKLVHNALQGSSRNLNAKEWKIYEDFNRHIAKHIQPNKWDYIIVEDHQLAAALSFMKNRGKAKWLWRSHTDSQSPNQAF